MTERAPCLKNIIPGTNKCNFESIEGRSNTCPNNPIRNPEHHFPKLCEDCPTNPRIAASTKKHLPSGYEAIRAQRYSIKKIS